jgi:hypothetical protein
MQANQSQHALRMLKHIVGYFVVSKDFMVDLQLTEQLANLRFQVG